MKRSMITGLIFVFLAFSFIQCQYHAHASNTEEVLPSQEKRLRHVVLFKFKETATPAEIKSVVDSFEALPAKISQIRSFEWGTNNSPEGLDKGFTHCFLLTFHSEEDRATYLPHPDHKAFGRGLSPYLEDVLVVDYWTEE